jgi:hypothetical protein
MDTEIQSYKSAKMCIVCTHFHWFHGSAGCCDAKAGCCAKTLMDCMDSCNCGKFNFDEKNNKE